MIEDYSNGKIYKIIDNTNGNIYVGSTLKSIEERLESHIKVYKEYLKYNNRYRSSFDILKNNDYKIVLIENCFCKSKKELLMREQYYMDNIICINKRKAYNSEEDKIKYQKNWIEKNRQEINKKKREYHHKNKQEENRKKREYDEKNKKNKKEYHKRLHQYKKSWGMWSDNNLLNISIDIFTYKIKS